MVDRMDRGIGKIVETLEKLGKKENTLILFLSDNGATGEDFEGNRPDVMPGPKESYQTVGPPWGNACNTPFKRYKTWMHEGGISTPMIAHWPRVIKANSISRVVGHINDILPTCLEIAGGKYPSRFNGHDILPNEGISLLPIYQGRKRSPHEYLFFEYRANRAVRFGSMKLVWDHTTRNWELYNIKDDRTEMINLAGQHPELVDQLSMRWIDWARKTNVPKKSLK